MKSKEMSEMDLLKNENQYLQKQLSKLNQKLQESDAFKGHFISNITNEIINPFTSILGISKNIAKLEGNRIGQIHSMANLIYNEAFDLDFQLQNIFAAAKIESGEISLELSSIEPVEFVENIIESLRFKSEKKSQYIELNIENNVPSNFVTDSEKLLIIIKNVISNAIIFGKEKSKIEINMFNDSEILKILVKNDGELMNLEELHSIYDRFTKLDKTINSINQGHGLGLSVTKAYLEILEGDIIASSSLDEGNIFVIQLPPCENDGKTLIRDNDLFIDDTEIF